jgi:antitoxin ParD1/3/4
MSVILNSRIEALVLKRVEAGRYSTPDEVIEEALQALDEREQLVRLREAIAVGDAELARGEGIPYTSELMAKIGRDAQAAIKRGEQPNSDVVP